MEIARKLEIIREVLRLFAESLEARTSGGGYRSLAEARDRTLATIEARYKSAKDFATIAEIAADAARLLLTNHDATSEG
jgi:hypothetical protein